MTADYVQNKHTKMRARIRPANGSFGRGADESKDGLELTRMQSFLEGRQDIFDILQQHSANSERPENVIPRPPQKAIFEETRPGMLEQKYNKLLKFLNKYGLLTVH